MSFFGPQDDLSVDPGCPHATLCATAGMAFGNLQIWGGGADFDEVFPQYRLEELVGAMTWSAGAWVLEPALWALCVALTSIFYPRYDSQKEQEAKPWGTPAQAFPGSARPDVAEGQRSPAQGPPRACGMQAAAPGAAGHSRQDFF